MGKSEHAISPFFIKKQQRMKKLLLPILAFLLAFCGCKNSINEKAGFDSIDEHMEFRKMGDLEVGIIGISSSGFAKMDTTEAYGFMDSVLRKGINYIDLCGADTATLNNIAFALKGRRNQILIQGPIGSCWKDNKHKRTRETKDCQADLDNLLKRLGTGYLNVGMLEGIDSKADWQKIKKSSSYLKYLNQLKEEGKIKRLGLVCSNVEAAYDALNSGIFDVLMLQVNPGTDLFPLDFAPEDSTTIDSLLVAADTMRTNLYTYCREHKIAVIATANDNDDNSPVDLSRMQQMHFTLTRPGVISILSNASNIEELARDLHYLSASDEEKDFSTLLTSDEPDESELPSDN